MLPGYCEIPLYKVSGNNFHPEKQVWTICGYITVDSDNYRRLNQYRWLRHWSPNTQFYYAMRYEKLLSGKYVHVYMAREILGLPWVAGKNGELADHINHNTLKNTRDNLRKVTYTQNQANKRAFGVQCRFKGIQLIRSRFRARIQCNGYSIQFQVMLIEVEAALMYNYAACQLFEEFANLNTFLEDEMPSYERQCELYRMVLNKLREVGLSLAV
jgi:hypothetical protein